MRIDVGNVVQLALTKVTLMVRNKAKELAPYDTGALRKSITSDFALVKLGISVVWSPVPYAKRRHFENNKNPQTLLYLERAYTEQEQELRKVFLDTIRKAL